MPYLTTFDSRQLRNVLGTFTTGVTIVTTRDGKGTPYGVTANSFSSVSLDPPLVLWSQALTSKSFSAFDESRYFAINILADDQIALSNHFAKSHDNKFANVAFHDGLGGSPVLKGTVAHFECVKTAAYPAGDHVIYLGRVECLGHSGRRPLAFAHGRYMVPYAHDLGPVSLQCGSAPVAEVEAVQVATEALPEIHRATGRHTLCLAVWGNHGPTAIRWERGDEAVSDHLRAGLVMSVTRTATGRVFAAFLPDEVTRSFVEEDLRLSRTADEDEAIQRQRFEAEIAATKSSGVGHVADVAPSQLHHVTLSAFSAPVFDPDGRLIMALSLASRASAIDDDRDGSIARSLAEAARALSARIAQRIAAPSASGDHA